MSHDKTLRKVIIEIEKQGKKQYRIWDGHAPIFLSHPVRFIVEPTDGGARIRDIKDGEFFEKTWEQLLKSALMTSTEMNISMKPVYSEGRFNAASLKPLTEMNSAATDTELAEVFKKSLMASGALLVLIAGISIIFGSKSEEIKEEELIPAKVAQLIMTKAPKADKPRSMPMGGESAPATATKKDPNVVQAFRSKALRSSVQGLLKGGMSKLLADSKALMAPGPANIDAAVNAAAGGSVAVNTDPKRGGVQVGTVEGAGGQGYAKGGDAKVKGQGGAFVSLDYGNASVEEGLTKDEVGKVVHAHMSEVRYCYETAMIRNPNVEGKLMMDFVIGANGRIKTASPKESSLKDPQLDDCIVRRLSRWEFPLPKGGVDVNVVYPFIFKSLGR